MGGEGGGRWGGGGAPANSEASRVTSATQRSTTSVLPYQGRPGFRPSGDGRVAPSGLWYTPSSVICFAPDTPYVAKWTSGTSGQQSA